MAGMQTTTLRFARDSHEEKLGMQWRGLLYEEGDTMEVTYPVNQEPAFVNWLCRHGWERISVSDPPESNKHRPAASPAAPSATSTANPTPGSGDDDEDDRED